MENITLLNATPLDQLQTELKGNDGSSKSGLVYLFLITGLLIFIAMYFDNKIKTKKNKETV